MKEKTEAEYKWRKSILESLVNLEERTFEDVTRNLLTSIENCAAKRRRGSRAKLSFDPKLEAFTLAKSLLIGLTYPHDWGFVPSTKADDGDPIDVMIIHDAATFPGLVISCSIIGILQIEQKRDTKVERNDRLFAVPR